MDPNRPRTHRAPSPGRHRATDANRAAASIPNPADRPHRPLRLLGRVGAATTTVALLLVAMVEVADAGSSLTVVAADSMNRSITAGFGTADTGGAYTVSSTSHTKVQNHAGVLGPLAPGHAVSATLAKVSVADVDVQTTVRMQPPAKSGSGQYFYTHLRQQRDGSAYYATLRVLPSGAVGLVATARRDGAVTALGKQVVVPNLSNPASGGLVVAAEIFGTSPVTVRMSAWVAGAHAPTTWQYSATDTRAGRIAKAGQLGVESYLSGSASGDAGAQMSHLIAWTGGSHAAAPTTPPSGSSTPPSSTPPSSTPPSSTPPSSTPPSSTPPSSTPPSSTPPSQPSSGAGAATLGTAKYSVPADAIYVATNGSDAAKGTKAAPFRSIAHAIAAAGKGATIVLRAGSYHESLSVPSNKPLTIEGNPGEVVWLDGSSAVGNWHRSGDHWIASDWTATFDSTPSYTNTVSTKQYWSFLNHDHPMAAHPDQVWLGNTELSQVGSADAVKAGSFYVDYHSHQIVLAQDPGSAPRASSLGIAITVNAPGSLLRGFGVRRYGTAVHDMGAIRLLGHDDAIADVVSTDNATTGLAVITQGVHVTHVTVSENGLLGMHGGYADGLTVDGLLSEHNNTEYFNFSPVSGGVKITRARGLTFKNSAFEHNNGPGLWFDMSCYDVTVTGNQVLNNAGNGVSFELSSTGVFADNVVSGNGAIAFKINDSNAARIWNNSFSNNGRNIEILEDLRRASDKSAPGHDPRRPLPDPQVPWITYDDVVMNNVLQPTTSGHPEVYVYDYSGEFSSAQLRADINGNLFLRKSSGSTPLIGWGTGHKKVSTYTSTTAFTGDTNLGSSNTESVAPSGKAARISATTHPLPLPADIAKAVGVAANTRHVGAFD